MATFVDSEHDGISPLSGARLLVVEDNEDSRFMLMTALEMYGAMVEAASDAREAVETLERQDFDLIVSDIGLPDEDGCVMLQRIRAREAGSGREVPAIALTGYASIEEERRALAAGFQKHLSKPIEPNQLISAVASLIKNEEKV